MKKMKSPTAKRLLCAALCAILLCGLFAACGSSQTARTQETEQPASDGPSAALKGVYDALVAPGSNYSELKETYASYYSDAKFTESLEADRFTISFSGTEYVEAGSWDYVDEGDALSVTLASDDYFGYSMYSTVLGAVSDYLGMDAELVSGYVSGVGSMGIENENWSISRDEAAGTTTLRMKTDAPWDMKELDQMVLNEAGMGYEPLDSNYISTVGSAGKLRFYGRGTVESFTMLFAEYGGLDDLAYQSMVNMAQLREPVGWEKFVADYTALEEVETDDYSVSFDVDDALIEEMFGGRDDRYGYVLVQFGAPERYGDWSEPVYETVAPSAEDLAESYFRVVGGYQKGVAGASLAEAKAACGALSFAVERDFWGVDIPALRVNMLEAWEGLTDEERASFDANFPDVVYLLGDCFEDWESVRGRFEDAGVADDMEELMGVDLAEQSWDTLSAHTWTLGNGDD